MNFRVLLEIINRFDWYTKTITKNIFLYKESVLEPLI